ncbi:MAG: Hsp20/alpha crystallin family protein [Candidatus Berkelbacteria bacterium]|nr:Hsp20/alpha crystallin family protein [Candidatus Berkelbacteria bacterium]
MMSENQASNDWLTEDAEGQLSIDVFQDNHNIYLIAPIAGVKASDVDITITDEVVSIKGHRQAGHEIGPERHLTQECYWGPFSRSYVLPIAINADQAKATLKDGLLHIEIPKDEKVKTKIIKVNA